LTGSLDGTQIAEQLKVVPPASMPEVPVIMLRRVMRPEIATMAKEHGAEACLMK
jgi:hypothetical protein